MHIRAASGRVKVGVAGRDDVSIQTMSGSVSVRLPTDVRPKAYLRSVSGRPRVECAAGEDCKIAVQSLSGSIEVVPDAILARGTPS